MCEVPINIHNEFAMTQYTPTWNSDIRLLASVVTAQLGLKAAAKARLWGAQAFQNSSLGRSDGFRSA
jgi:hypothetical protein